MKASAGKRRIVEAAVGAALGAAIAGPAGAVAGGLAANRAAAKVDHLGERKRARKRASANAKDPVVHARVRRILVPLDFSPFSLRTVRFARKWASHFRAEICLVHVMEPVNTIAPFAAEPIALPPPPPDFRRQLTAGLEKLIRKEFSRIAKVSIHLCEGIAHDEIVSAARALKADLIIIATHGRTGLMHALIGSTAERVVRHARCPVLVLH